MQGMPPMPSTQLDRQRLTDADWRALLSLLADEDPAVYQTVRQRILSESDRAVRQLRPATLSNDPIQRRRAAEIIDFITRHASDDQFLAFCLNSGEDLDLEMGALLLAQTQYPGINIAGYEAIFDDFAREIRESIDLAAPATQIIGTINDFLFRKHGFHGNEENYYEADNSYLNRVIDRRKGNPISLCLIYLFLARRLRLPVAGIGMPGHFLCRFQATTDELFIDAFNNGKVLTKGDCVKYLLHTRDGFKEAYLAPVSPRRTLLRVCSNLHQIYSQLNKPEAIARFQRYIVALAK